MKVIANFDIYQTIGSLQVHRPNGSQFELADAEADAAIAAGHVRKAPSSAPVTQPTHKMVRPPPTEVR